ncbi:MAG: calcium-translocating P-type ATPase, PMCA-type, partial [Firmicutes bacterium]|nr:calcium-translocating P-type ATPase, PMCA-type [Bacillota bacterium]
MQAHSREKEILLKELNSNGDLGLSSSQIKENAIKYGQNVLDRKKSDSLIKRLLVASSEKMVLLLIFAWLIALGVSIADAVQGNGFDYAKVFGILIAILISVVITVAMEGRSAKAFEALNKLNENNLIRVIREGAPVLINQKELVVGDIVIVETGDKITADGRVLSANSLYSNESALTGESMPASKNPDMIFAENTPVADRKNMLYSGCFITEGSGKMAVSAVGMQTEFGKIAKELNSKETTTTPLQEKLGQFGKTVAMLGLIVASLIFIVQIIGFWANGNLNFENISTAFITSVVLIVAAVPEGLPAIVAVTLSVNVIKMAKHNALVKKLVASETAGCVNIICSDKTGTLTENKMTVSDIYVLGQIVKPERLGNKELIFNMCVNSTADISGEGKEIKFLGNPTECALLVASAKAGADYNEYRRTANIARVYAFSSQTKSMTTVVKNENSYTVYTKGSPEKVLAMCLLNCDQKTEIENEIIRFQKNASRVIAFAHKKTYEFDPENICEVESGLTFDGFVAISDPLRETVYDAVKECARAGIELKMLTGDNLITAIAIAKEINILKDKIAVEASELENLSDEEFSEKIKSVCVIARSTPLIKMRVVKALKDMGNVVAVTGDGINDAPALKSADIGIAMGISGTDVSKEASDIVLLDDSFSTIATAVKWGRAIYENFKRFIQFQLTVNVASVSIVLISVLLGVFLDSYESPFTAVQLLWINLIMDGPPAITLGLEPVRGNIMENPPTKRGANIISQSMLARIVVNGAFMAVVLLTQQGINFLGVPTAEKATVIFAVFALFQLFNSFNARELNNESIFKHIFKNKPFII